MKKCMMLMIVLLLLSGFTAAAADEVDTDAIYEEYYSDSGADALTDALPDYAQQLIDGLGLDIADYQSFSDASSTGMLQIVAGIVGDGLKTPLKSLAVCISVVLLSAVVASLGGEEMIQVSGYISVLAVAAGGFYPLIQTVENTVTAIQGVSGFVTAFVPVYAGILLAGGKAATAASVNSLLLFAAWLVSSVISALVIPVVSAYTALVFSTSATDLKVIGLTDSIKKFATWVLGLSLTIFCGVLGIQTGVSAAGDNVSLKAARFVAGSFLPVVGSAVSDALSTVGSCIGLLRSTTGAYGLVAIVAIMLPVLAELTAWRLVLLLSETASDLFTTPKLSALFKNIGSAVSILIGVAIWITLLFIISLTVVVISGGGS